MIVKFSIMLVFAFYVVYVKWSYLMLFIAGLGTLVFISIYYAVDRALGGECSFRDTFYMEDIGCNGGLAFAAYSMLVAGAIRYLQQEYHQWK